MRAFMNSPFDESRFDAAYTRAMLMALVVHVFYKDWGTLGAVGVFAGCALYAFFLNYARFRDREPPVRHH